MQNCALRPLLQSVTKRTGELVELHHQHRGSHRILVPEGTKAWRYYLLSPKQARFWSKLGKTERGYLTRLARSRCFVCTLKDSMEGQERFEASLYRGMMSFLLTR
jgi:hypothetical protein